MSTDDKNRKTESDKLDDRRERKQQPDEYRIPPKEKEYDFSETDDSKQGGYDEDLIDDNRRRAGSGDENS